MPTRITYAKMAIMSYSVAEEKTKLPYQKGSRRKALHGGSEQVQPVGRKRCTACTATQMDSQKFPDGGAEANGAEEEELTGPLEGLKPGL